MPMNDEQLARFRELFYGGKSSEEVVRDLFAPKGETTVIADGKPRYDVLCDPTGELVTMPPKAKE